MSKVGDARSRSAAGDFAARARSAFPGSRPARRSATRGRMTDGRPGAPDRGAVLPHVPRRLRPHGLQRSSSPRCRTTSTWTSTRSPRSRRCRSWPGSSSASRCRSGPTAAVAAPGSWPAARSWPRSSASRPAIATTIGLFGLSRAGFGFGLIVNDPVQQSLLADYTPVRRAPVGVRRPPDGRQPRAASSGRWCSASSRSRSGGGRRSFAVAVLGVGRRRSLSLRLRGAGQGRAWSAPRWASPAPTSRSRRRPPASASRGASSEAIPTVRTLWFSLPFLFGGVLGDLRAHPAVPRGGASAWTPAERGIAQAAASGIPAHLRAVRRHRARPSATCSPSAPWRMFRLMAGIALGDRPLRRLARRRADPRARRSSGIDAAVAARRAHPAGATARSSRS